MLSPLASQGNRVSRTRNGATHHNSLAPPPMIKSTYGLDCLTVIGRENNFKAFRNWIWNIYGRDISSDAIGQLYRDLKERKLQDPRSYDPGQDKVKHPPILIDTDLVRFAEGGHVSVKGELYLGAYLDERIYVDMELVADAYNDDESAWTLMAVLAEEFGHHLDYVLRNQYDHIGGDAPLEEGAVFASMLVPTGNEGILGFEFAYDDKNVPFTMATVPMPAEWGVFFPETRIAEYRNATQGQGEYAEFFSATDDEVIGQRHVHMIGHQGIERRAIEALIRAGIDGWTEKQRRYVYFGNWQRDFSQFGDPKVLKALKRLEDKIESWDLSLPDVDVTGKLCQGVQGVNAWIQDTVGWDKLRHAANDFGVKCEQTTTPAMPRYPQVVPAIVDLLAEEHFGPGYPVNDLAGDPYRLGVYIPAEHIDNPAGTTDERQWDPRFRPAYDPAEGAIIQTGVRAGLRAYMEDSVAYIKSQFTAAMTDKPDAHGIPGDGIQLMLLGNGLHTLEDYFAHSNFCELWLRGMDLAHPVVNAKTFIDPAPLPSGMIDTSGGPFYPITTGIFGGLDTAVSIMGVLAEHLAKEETEIAEKPEPSKVSRLLLILVNRHSRYAGKVYSYWLSIKIFSKLPKYIQELIAKGIKKLYTFCRNAIIWAAVEVILELMGAKIMKLTGAPQSQYDDLLKAVKDHNVNLCIKAMGVLMQLDGPDIAVALAASGLVELGPDDEVHIHQSDALSVSEALEELAGLYQELEFYDTHEPTHSQLAKDHPTNPCHQLAVQCATWAVDRVLRAYKPIWNMGAATPDPAAVQRVMDEVDKIIRHPRLYDAPERAAVDAIVASWKAADGGVGLAEVIRRGAIPPLKPGDTTQRRGVFRKMLGNLHVLLNQLSVDRGG